MELLSALEHWWAQVSSVCTHDEQDDSASAVHPQNTVSLFISLLILHFLGHPGSDCFRGGTQPMVHFGITCQARKQVIGLENIITEAHFLSTEGHAMQMAHHWDPFPNINCQNRCHAWQFQKVAEIGIMQHLLPRMHLWWSKQRLQQGCWRTQNPGGKWPAHYGVDIHYGVETGHIYWPRIDDRENRAHIKPRSLCMHLQNIFVCLWTSIKAAAGLSVSNSMRSTLWHHTPTVSSGYTAATNTQP